MEKYQVIENSLITKFRKDIWAKFVKGVKEFEMIQENDKIAVCMSGGKDSYILAKCMQEIQRHGKVKFELVFLVMDPGYTKENRRKIEENAKTLAIPITIVESDIFQAVEKIEQSPCYLCARMRRGTLYSKAQELGCNKIALGHHYDDVMETILLSTIYGGEFKTMMPKLHSTNFKGMELIRPLYYVREKDIISFAKYHQLEFLNCACKFTAENNDQNLNSKRLVIKHLIAELKKDNPYIENNIFKSAFNVNLDTIIGYHRKDFEYNFLDDYDKEDK
jgi:predicted ATPase of the PP-loop superfamily implicated in cell cycle control